MKIFGLSITTAGTFDRLTHSLSCALDTRSEEVRAKNDAIKKLIAKRDERDALRKENIILRETLDVANHSNGNLHRDVKSLAAEVDRLRETIHKGKGGHQDDMDKLGQMMKGALDLIRLREVQLENGIIRGVEGFAATQFFNS